MSVLPQNPEDIADVDADTAVHLLDEIRVAGKRFLVAVEGQTHQLTAGIEDR